MAAQAGSIQIRPEGTCHSAEKRLWCSHRDLAARPAAVLGRRPYFGSVYARGWLFGSQANKASLERTPERTPQLGIAVVDGADVSGLANAVEGESVYIV